MPIVIRNEDKSPYIDINACQPMDVVETECGSLLLVVEEIVDRDRHIRRLLDLRDGVLFAENTELAKNHGPAYIDKESFK
jgi:hypothetical protein